MYSTTIFHRPFQLPHGPIVGVPPLPAMHAASRDAMPWHHDHAGRQADSDFASLMSACRWPCGCPARVRNPSSCLRVTYQAHSFFIGTVWYAQSNTVIMKAIMHGHNTHYWD